MIKVEREASAERTRAAVSFVVPVHNGARTIRATIASIFAQGPGPFEVVIVDDQSTDGSSSILQSLSTEWPLRIVAGEGRGAAAALNTGIRAAQFSIVCQIDQDVVLEPGWLCAIVDGFAEPSVAAVQGYYAADSTATIFARVMALDLEDRYAAIPRGDVDHVCTGNAAYRVEALRAIGMFDESLGYGYDNDVSYRLRAAGYTLRFCRAARSLHAWRDDFAGYVVQQYGFGYGRLDVVAKHPARWSGDQVSPTSMMFHPAILALAIGTAALSPSVGLTLFAMLVGERVIAGGRAARRSGQWAALLFPAIHLVRDAAWIAAAAVWTMRRARGLQRRPSHSMYPRPAVYPSPNLPPM